MLNGLSNSVAVPLALNENLSVSATTGNRVTLSGVVSDVSGKHAAVSMAGSGTLVLSNANTYSGGTTINGGIVKLGNSSALGSFPTNVINDGGTLDVGGQTLPVIITATTTNRIIMNNNSTIANSSANTAVVQEQLLNPSGGGQGVNINGSGNIEIDELTGNGAGWNVTNLNTGTVNFAGTNDNIGLRIISVNGTTLLAKDKSNPANYAGNSSWVAGGLTKMMNDGQIWTGGTLTYLAGSGGTFDMNGHVMTVASLNSTVTNNGVLMNNATNTTGTLTYGGGTFNATARDGLGKLALVATGSATLGGTNLFTGGLTVNGGTMTISNSVSTNLPITVASGAVLNLHFSGTNQIQSLTLGGVSQANGLYSSGNASPYITGAGILQVGPLVIGSTGPAYLTNSVSGNTLSLSWPAGQGWRLQMQNNSVSVGLSNNWVYITDTTINSTNIILSKTDGATFYRLHQ